MKYKQKYTLLTFYHFIDIENPEAEVEKHYKFCKDIGMKGRVYIGTEGISSTVTCNEGQLKAYKLFLQDSKYFRDIEDIDVKSSPTDGHKFPRMAVKFREEIVALGKKYSGQEIENGGKRMHIDEFKKMLDSDDPESYVVLDMRNNHEYKLGHFKNAVPAKTISFRELHDKLDEYRQEFADKKIITYCTGGIRCEKATVMMQEAGLKNTYQLDGGVVKYINTYDDGNWLGNLYVFDDRVSQQVGTKDTHTTIGECLYTGEKTDNCENCRYSACNGRLIVTPKAYKKHFGFCSEECAEKAVQTCLVKVVDFDPMNYKKERQNIKNHPELEDEIIAKIQKHLKKHLDGVQFPHKKSQKEDFVID